MKEQLQEFFELPFRVKALIVGGAFALLLVGYYYLFYSGVDEEITAITARIDGPKGLRANIQQKKTIVLNLPKFLAEVEKLDIELKAALAELPDKKEMAQLLESVSNKAKEAGLEMRLFKTQNEEKHDFYAELPAQLELTGTYHQVATFFDEVGRFERIVNLDRFEMTDPVEAGDQMGLKTAVMATTFRFLDESERPAPVDDNKGRRRR